MTEKQKPRFTCYALVASTDLCRIRYIGVTGQPLEFRLGQHLSETTNSPKADWIRSVFENGAQVLIVPLSRHENENEAQAAEKLLIRFFNRRRGLLNRTGHFVSGPPKRKVDMTFSQVAVNVELFKLLSRNK